MLSCITYTKAQDQNSTCFRTYQPDFGLSGNTSTFCNQIWITSCCFQKEGMTALICHAVQLTEFRQSVHFPEYLFTNHFRNEQCHVSPPHSAFTYIILLIWMAHMLYRIVQTFPMLLHK